jgi:uncharacterized protein
MAVHDSIRRLCLTMIISLAAIVIDSLKFAAAEEHISGQVKLASLERLADVLLSTEGFVSFELRGFCDRSRQGIGAQGEKKMGLQLRVSGRLELCCQRCLSAVSFDCAINSRLLLMPPGSQEADWTEDELVSDDYDAIPASCGLSVQALIEDEVLLALPIVPRHANCQSSIESEFDDKEKNVPSPFAVLAGFKKH